MIGAIAGLFGVSTALVMGGLWLGFRNVEGFGDVCERSDHDLHRLARAGDVDALRTALDDGADPDARDQHANTALGCALPLARVEVAAVLLERGADANGPSGDPSLGYEELPLELALSNHDDPGVRARLISLVLDHGADPDKMTAARHDLVLVEALSAGDLALAQQLVDHGADVDGAADQVPLSALGGDERAVSWLLDHGADPNGRPGHRPLVAAAAGFSFPPASFDVLLERGADPTRQFDDGAETTADRALAAAAAGGHADRVTRLLALGADPNRSDPLHDPLLAAVASRHPDVVAVLLDAGADPNRARFDYSIAAVAPITPMLRSSRIDEGTEATLEAVGAALLPAQSVSGTTATTAPSTAMPGSPLGLAEHLGDAEIAQLLRDHGAVP